MVRAALGRKAVPTTVGAEADRIIAPRLGVVSMARAGRLGIPVEPSTA